MQYIYIYLEYCNVSLKLFVQDIVTCNVCKSPKSVIHCLVVLKHVCIGVLV